MTGLVERAPVICEAITEAFGEQCKDFDPDCWACKAWAELDRLTSELSEARIAELEAALDEKEVASGLTGNGNLWRFWSTKASAIAVKNAELETRLKEAELVIAQFADIAKVEDLASDGEYAVNVNVSRCRAARTWMEGK